MLFNFVNHYLDFVDVTIIPKYKHHMLTTDIQCHRDVIIACLFINYTSLVAMQQLASDCWSLAVDSAVGRLLDAFIVSCHKDLLLLRDCAKEAYYRNVQIIIYDFAKPR